MKAKAFERTLVVAAHPDDEILGCGATLAGLAAQGKEVHVLILGGVTTSRYAKNATEEEGKKEQFKDETEKAAKILGAKSLHRFDFPDNRFDSVTLLELVKKVEEVKNSVKPTSVFTHDYVDLNVDHRLTHQAVLTAFRPDGADSAQILTFESLSSTEWQDRSLGHFSPNYYVDVSATLGKKLDAMKCYASELRPYPHPRSLEGIEILAKRRGLDVGLHAAEAFRLVRAVF